MAKLKREVVERTEDWATLRRHLGIVTLTLGEGSRPTKREHQVILGPLRPLYAAIWIPVTSFQTWNRSPRIWR